MPCYNESDNAEETLRAAAAVDYPDFEVIAINDGSRDNTAEVLDRLAARSRACASSISPTNQGKATALNIGALLARHEILVCIDGDALLDPHALRWIARVFTASDVGGLAGNPRIRNRTSLLGRLQVGEFSSIIGLIRRAQTVYGRLFTVSGVICAFRKRALEEAGWWSPRTITDDIDVTWRVQIAGWRVIYRAQRHRLDPDARDPARPVEAAPALGRGRRGDDDRLLRADDPRPRAEPAADLPQLRAQHRCGPTACCSR